MSPVSALLLTILFACPWSLLAESREYWLKTERQGTGHANQHVLITKLPSGNFRYDTTEHIKWEVSGQKRDLILTGAYIVDPDLRPLSFETRLNSHVKETHTSGVRTGDMMAVTVQSKGSTQAQRQIPIADVYFGIVLSELIVRNAGNRKFRLSTLVGAEVVVENIEIVSIDEREITASAASSAFISRYRISRDGQLLDLRVSSWGVRVYATTPADARNITYFVDNDLEVRSQKRIPNVFGVSRARLQVRWKRLPFSEFSLEDNRQKVESKNQSGDEFEAVIEVTRPAVASDEPEPHDEPGSEYLGEDEYIKPRDAGIREQAAAIAGETKSPVETVRKLLEWVDANVTYEIVLETLTGPEVLEMKRGKCSESAVLFASLAKAAGIPTRMAFGESYSGERWDGHMWNEVWLGNWVAVDPSFGTFVAGPSHLKLADSPTVAGLRAVRFGLGDSLRIEILDFVEDGPRTPRTTGIRGRSYVNGSFGCKISAPDDTWVLTEKSDVGITLSMKPKKGGAEFALGLFRVSPGTAAAGMLQQRLNAAGKFVRNYKLVESGEVEIALRKAASAVFTQRGNGGTIVNYNVILIDGYSGYLFAFIAPEEEFARLGPTLKEILGSFELLQ